jgi:NAD(P)-dependent dehydrogenase (short-subunit alcohol dehydrogenase family)
MEQHMDSLISLEGKVALITGGGAGMGRAIAETFGGLGAKVVVAEIDGAFADNIRNALTGEKVDCMVEQIDARSTNQIEDLIRKIDQRFSRLDVLVNNVGHYLVRGLKRFDEFTEEEWDGLYQINLRHMFVATRAALPLMRKSGQGGSIINFSSIEGFRGYPNGSVYAAFKAAAAHFAKSLAVELGPEHIRVNCIAPETTDSEQVPLSKLMPPENAQVLPFFSTPLGRYGLPSDAAGCAVFLATDLSAWVTGTTIHMDGGALAAGGWYRMLDGRWINAPIIRESGLRQGRRRNN